MGEKFFVRSEGHLKMYQLIEEMPGLYLMKADGVRIPHCYIFLTVEHMLRVYIGSGIAITQEVSFREIQFIH